MNLYLVQHAEAKSKEEDPDRPLSTKGTANIGKVATYVAEHTSIQVEQIFHSGKTRAEQTAEALAKALSPRKGVRADSNLGATDDPSIWADKLAEMEESVMLVGHLPYMSKLAALLTCQDSDKKVVDFQNGGVVCLNKNEESEWTVQWIVTPQIVEE